MTVAIEQSACERNNPFTYTNHVKSYKSAFLTELFSIDLKTEAKSRTSQRPVIKHEREKFWYPQKIWPLVWGKMLRNMPSFVAFFLRSRNHRLQTTQYTFISPLSAPFPILCGKKRRRETNRKWPSNLFAFICGLDKGSEVFPHFFLAEPFPHQLKPNHTSARKTTATPDRHVVTNESMHAGEKFTAQFGEGESERQRNQGARGEMCWGARGHPDWAFVGCTKKCRKRASINDFSNRKPVWFGKQGRYFLTRIF